MKVTNITAFATIGCDVQLSENDRLALGIELDKVTNWLIVAKAAHATVGEDSETEPIKAINNLVAFVSKFAIRPSKSNVFTDSVEDFKKADKSTTAVEPTPEDDVITVNIANAKDLLNLKKIIYEVTNLSLVRIKDRFNSAKENHATYISFRCMNKRKEEVVDEIVGAGYQIVPNGVNSFNL